ncbi:hypothetical protein [Streptomyces asoensis]|uniref:Knr4/Smi1-like domain-containing protein n=1 Tax=Streptomyces asoensis TaxID=249586 RepID=A0ABQ3SCC5_9ACTN|nr:hypothetical protein [Streptomyces asoensis]GGQ97690.1 hypothetical protein GCM10010496_73370 [Streptomyces asoensis]GHI65754.1 hypothetical protein Saso_74040 [Streptomyces asoensis]
MHDLLRRLRGSLALLHEEGERGDVVDWRAAAAELQVESFPEDYMEFVSAFGAGTIEESLFISIPRPGTTGEPLSLTRLPGHARRSASMNTWQEVDEGLRNRLEDMLVWGQTNSADMLCWVTSGADPDQWPLAVWERHGGGWKIHKCGMVEFLLKLLSGEFSECPVSDETLWGIQSARFLNFRDEERIIDTGIDPWTGRTVNRFD